MMKNPRINTVQLMIRSTDADVSSPRKGPNLEEAMIDTTKPDLLHPFETSL